MVLSVGILFWALEVIESALQLESSQAADIRRASCGDVLEHFCCDGLQAMKKADAEEAPAMKSMKARSFLGAGRLGSCRIVACLRRSLGAASAYQRLRSSHMVAEVGLFSTLRQHQWMHKA